MKNLILLIAVLFSFAACTVHDGYTIKGRISGDSESLKSGKAYLANADREHPIRDTAEIVNGKFVFKGKLTTPEQYTISIEGVQGAIPVFVENEAYQVTGIDSTLRDSDIVGGATQHLIVMLKAKNSELEQKHDLVKIVAEYRIPETSEDRKKEIMSLYDKFTEELTAFENEVIYNNPLSHFSLQNLYRKVADMAVPEAKEKLAAFKADVKFEGNRFIASIEEVIALNETLEIGKIAPDFTLKNPDGKEISLSDVYKKNKVTMIDFWAGWCPPCRVLNPKLVALYNKFHRRGFEILGVSMDRDRDTWLKAIKDDKLKWPQVSDVNYFDTEPVKLYNVRFIPQNVFVDQEGRIIARKLDKDKMEEFLKENL